jgi:hypothetical protein
MMKVFLSKAARMEKSLPRETLEAEPSAENSELLNESAINCMKYLYDVVCRFGRSQSERVLPWPHHYKADWTARGR